MKDATNLSDAQIDALKAIAPAPMKRGKFLSGWGPRGHKDRRITVSEGTANVLISLGMIERIDVEEDEQASTIQLTSRGRSLVAMLATAEQGVEPTK